MASDPRTTRWICEICGYIYDPTHGDPANGVWPQTPFEDVPEDWHCPDCGASKADFQPMD